MAIPERVKNLMKKHGLKGVNKPKRTPSHPKKSHIVMAKEGEQYKLIRFGEQGAKTVPGKPRNKAEAEKKASFKRRHAKNIKKGKMSGSWWSNKEKW